MRVPERVDRDRAFWLDAGVAAAVRLAPRVLVHGATIARSFAHTASPWLDITLHHRGRSIARLFDSSATTDGKTGRSPASDEIVSGGRVRSRACWDHARTEPVSALPL